MNIFSRGISRHSYNELLNMFHRRRPTSVCGSIGVHCVAIFCVTFSYTNGRRDREL